MYKTKWLVAPLEQEDGEFTDISVNGLKMTEDIENACNIMEEEGYVLVGSPTPVIKGVGVGRYAALINKSAIGNAEQYGEGWGYGYGFSFTSGVMLLFRNDKK